MSGIRKSGRCKNPPLIFFSLKMATERNLIAYALFHSSLDCVYGINMK